MKKYKILFINGGLMDYGGISSFIYNYVSHFDLNKFQIDIAVHGLGDGMRDEDLLKIGCRIFHLPIKSQNYFAWKKALLKLVLNDQYDIIHANADAGNGAILKTVRPYIPVRISHSHNTSYLTHNSIRLILNYIQKVQIKLYATDLFACGLDAGRWLYGNKVKFEVINNAVDYNQYTFHLSIRQQLRSKQGISDHMVVVGHVGRFDYQKNHYFLLQIAERMRSYPYLFILIGDGHLRPEIERIIQEKQLDNIIMMGNISNVHEYLNLMDCFILPSLFEGLPISLIEAQVNGLDCMVSSTITKEIKISDSIEWLDIEHTEVWVDRILQKSVRHHLKPQKLDDSYNIDIQAKLLQDKYETMINDAGN